MTAEEFLEKVKEAIRGRGRHLNSFGQFLRDVYLEDCPDKYKFSTTGRIRDDFKSILLRRMEDHREYQSTIIEHLKLALKQWAIQEGLSSDFKSLEGQVSGMPLIWQDIRVSLAMRKYQDMIAEIAISGRQNQVSNELVCLCYKYLTRDANALTLVNKRQAHRLVGILACLFSADELHPHTSQDDISQRVGRLVRRLCNMKTTKPVKYTISQKCLDRLKEQINIIELYDYKCGPRLSKDRARKEDALGEEHEVPYPLYSFITHGIISYVLFTDRSDTIIGDQGEQLPSHQGFYSIDAATYGEMDPDDAQSIYMRLWVAEKYSSENPNSDYPFTMALTDACLRNAEADFRGHGIHLELPMA